MVGAKRLGCAGVALAGQLECLDHVPTCAIKGKGNAKMALSRASNSGENYSSAPLIWLILYT